MERVDPNRPERRLLQRYLRIDYIKYAIWDTFAEPAWPGLAGVSRGIEGDGKTSSHRDLSPVWDEDKTLSTSSLHMLCHNMMVR
jgi:hypothetical protein